MKLNVIKSMSFYLGILFLLVSGVASANHLAQFWSPFTSEEYPPLTSPNRYLINRMQCTGSFCDNVRIQNVLTSRTYNHSYWSSFFSEEGSGSGLNQRTCTSSSEFMTGIACNGGYCDNVSIQCTQLLSSSRSGCYWTASFSEEQVYSEPVPAGYYAAGLRCLGSNCDNKQIYMCRLL